MSECLFLLPLAVAFGGLNLWGHRIGAAPAGGGWIRRDRFPRGYKIIMAVDWLIFAMVVVAVFVCLYQKLQ